MAGVLKYGSQGDDVKRLQEALNSAGYGLSVDGIYGEKTQDAVRQYQQSSGLSADGIANDSIWSKLTEGGHYTPQTQKTPFGTEYDSNRTTGAQADLGAVEGGMPQFAPSQAYQDALDALKDHQAGQPGEYESPFNDRLNALYEQVMGRGDFEYDFNADALYHQYRDRYAQEGQRAMQDTMANAAALTGGYGNSYAASAGQQAYNQYMSAANDMIPQLEQRAYERWRAEGDDAMQQLALLRDMDATEYGRYQDDKNEYYQMLEYLTGAAGDQYQRDYAVYQDALSAFFENRDYYYGKAQDEEAEEEAEKSRSSRSSSSSKSSGSSGSSKSSSNSTGDLKEQADELPKLTLEEAEEYLQEIRRTEGLVAEAETKKWLLENGYIEF